MAHIDPALLKEVDRLREANRSLQALVVLDRASVAEQGSAVGEVVDSLMDEVQRESQVAPSRVVVFKNIRSFAIEAPARFIDQLLKHQQVVSATLNE